MTRAFRLWAIQTTLMVALLAPFAVAAEDDPESGRLEPTYQPRPPPEEEVYTTDYLFGITRAVSESTLVPAAQIPLYFFTIPLDVAFFPIELVAGFFPRD